MSHIQVQGVRIFMTKLRPNVSTRKDLFLIVIQAGFKVPKMETLKMFTTK